MHRLVIASLVGAGLSIGFGGAASAADLSPMYTKAPLAAPSSWTGFYVGVEGGYGWSDPTVTATGNDILMSSILKGCCGFTSPLGPVDFNDKGIFGGVTAGYNWQLGRSWLAGIETDFSESAISGQGVSGPATLVPGVLHELSATQNIQWFGTVRPRLGWLPTDNLLLYGTGGFAYGRVNESVSWGTNIPGTAFFTPYAAICPGAFGPCVAGTSSRTATGWTAGAGAEYRVPGTNASFKVEYLFVDLGSGDVVTAAGLNTPAGSKQTSFSAAYSGTEFQTVKAGLNWHF